MEDGGSNLFWTADTEFDSYLPGNGPVDLAVAAAFTERVHRLVTLNPVLAEHGAHQLSGVPVVSAHPSDATWNYLHALGPKASTG